MQWHLIGVLTLNKPLRVEGKHRWPGLSPEGFFKLPSNLWSNSLLICAHGVSSKLCQINCDLFTCIILMNEEQSATMFLWVSMAPFGFPEGHQERTRKWISVLTNGSAAVDMAPGSKPMGSGTLRGLTQIRHAKHGKAPQFLRSRKHMNVIWGLSWLPRFRH